MRLLYNLSIRFFGIAVRIAALFKAKARQWVKGRKDWRTEISKAVKNTDGLIWFHCSSLGEFEQGRPIIDALSKRGEKILLTFFSPSGFENLKDYKEAYHVCYLPLDTSSNAEKWINIINPKAVFFVKYEFWYNYIFYIKKNNIPLFLVSGIFRKSQYFFKFYGKWFAQQLTSFTHFFVQDKVSEDLLKTIGINQVGLSGDTRFDRVIDISSDPKDIPVIDSFCNNEITLVAGSTWPKDEDLLLQLLQHHDKLKLVIAPHDVNEERINNLLERTKNNAVLFSASNANNSHRIMIVDRIGFLSSIYRYGQIAYIGGGFGSGIHNTLEAAVYGLPIIFGQNYKKFREARDMTDQESAFSINNFDELLEKVRYLLEFGNSNNIGKMNRDYVINQQGATNLILNHLEELHIISTL